MEIDDRGWGRGGGGRGGGGGGGGSRRCDHFARTGTCKFGDNCRFEHVRSGQGRGGRGGGGRGGGGGDGRNDRVDQSRDAFGGGGAFGRLSGGVFGGSSGGGGAGGGGAGGGGQRQVCRNYSRTGSCRWGDTCRHIHEGAPSSDSSSPFGASAASPFGAQAASSPFGAASSSPFGAAAAPSSPFGAAAASPFGGAQPSSPFAAQPQPQPPSGFSEVAHQFVKFFYEAFCSARRSELQVLLRDDSCLTLNDQKLGGRERIMQQFMSLPMDLGNLQIRNLESHPTGPDMSSVLILVMGSVQMSNAQLQINHVFVLMKAQEGQYWISNMIQRWSQ